MAVEYTKWMKTFKGFAPAVEKCTDAAFDKCLERVRANEALIVQGEQALAEAAVKAANEGADIKDIKGLLKLKPIVDAIGDIDLAVVGTETLTKEYDALYKNGETLQASLEKMKAEIAKDLKSRSKSSESRNDIIDLQEAVEFELKRVGLVLGRNPLNKIHADVRTYRKNLIQNATTVLAKAENTAKTSLKRQVKHKYLDLKNLNKLRSTVVALSATVKSSCEAAVKAYGTSREKAATEMGTAKDALGKAAEIVKSFEDVFKVNERDIDKSPDGDKIKSERALMGKALENAEKLFGVVNNKLVF